MQNENTIQNNTDDDLLSKKINLEPYNILDIIKKDDQQFQFVINFKNAINQDEKQKLTIQNLGVLHEKFKLYLLAKYKKTLKAAQMQQKFFNFVEKRYALLTEYCNDNDIDIKKLQLRSSLPPTQVYSNQITSQVIQKEGTKKRNKKERGKHKKKICCNQEKKLPQKLQNEKTLQDQKRILDCLYDKTQFLLKKYKNSSTKKISQVQFFKEIEELIAIPCIVSNNQINIINCFFMFFVQNLKYQYLKVKMTDQQKIDSKLTYIQEQKLMEKLRKVMYAAGFSQSLEDETINIALESLKKFVSQIFCFEFIEQVQIQQENQQKITLLMYDYLCFLFEEEFFVFQERFNEEMYIKLKSNKQKTKKFETSKQIILRKLKKLKHLRNCTKIKKIRKNQYYLQRNKNLNGEQLKELERSKETLIFTKHHPQKLFKNIQNFTNYNINFLLKDPFLLHFLNYSLTINLKYFNKKSHRTNYCTIVQFKIYIIHRRSQTKSLNILGCFKHQTIKSEKQSIIVFYKY